MLKTFLIRSIRRYQETLSPKLYERGVRCIFEQSCSNYAIAVLEHRSTLTACVLIVYRILRCNPINGFIIAANQKPRKAIQRGARPVNRVTVEVENMNTAAILIA